MTRFVALALVALMMTGCRNEPAAETSPEQPAQLAQVDPAAHEQEIRAWQTRRVDRLKEEDSWLTLVGLHWLQPGENSIGSASGNRIVLPAKAPASAGSLLVREGAVTLRPDAAMTIAGQPVSGEVPLLADMDEQGPTLVNIGTIQFQVIRRAERLGLRVKDSQAETRLNFAGLEFYPIDPKWRVEARLERYDPPKVIPITDVTGTTAENISPGALVFTHDGQEHRLDPILEDGRLFIIFKDETSRDTTYPAGRYLYADMPEGDAPVIVEFNRAYNPPCAFTDFATCPLPPPQNRVAVRIEAGEKKYALAH
ncbi:MAG TPA: DUF1684 domain-containing protein [Thermoanaerobaculia bacterium]